uniref:hypothetical protein n=1 Tax=Enhygromyxa salina TaxID=215803 RepID=UPI001C62B9BF
IPTGRGAGAGPASSGPKALPLSGRRSATRPRAAGKSGGAGGGKSGSPSAEATPAEGEVDPVATAVAKNWARAFTKGEITTMVNRAALPFRSGSAVAAKSKEELRGLLEALADEVAGKSAKVDKTYTAASLRKKFGSVPAGVEEGEGRLYTVVEIGGDTVILMLEKRYGSWRIIGITR